MKMSEVLFYAESEGLLPTRAGRINAVINDIKNYPASTIEFDVFEQILNNYNLTYLDLSERERNYITASIA